MDARSLLRAKKAEARIEHPYASYSARGELRCSVCAVPVKQWDAHLLTKSHRTSAAREKANQQAKAAKQAMAVAAPKRPLGGDGDTSGGAGPSTKKAKTGPAGLPEGFFSNGNAPIDDEDDDDEERDEDRARADQPAMASTSASGDADESKTAPEATGDNELDDFLASLSTPSELPSDPAGAPGGDYAITKVSQGRTGAAAGRKHVPRYKEVEPGQASYEAAPVLNQPLEAKEEEEEKEPEPEETEKERRERLAREEREDIVRRLEEEERAQEDADSRVTSLKERMALLKKRRKARAAAGTGANGAVDKGPKGKGKGTTKENGTGHA